MKHILTLMMLVLIAASCTERSDINAVLDHADSIMVAHPDSALSLLDSIGMEKETFPRSQLMRYELLHADAQNKAYVDFTTDSVMATVAEYYDAHGTPNEKMRAYYLLGCTYRDLHEAPMTLQCYQTAVEKADTTSNDCDFYTMASIYGQMAELYHSQLLAKEELTAQERYSWCSAKAGDKYGEIRGVELRIKAYSIMGDTTSIFNTIYLAHDLFVKNKMPQAAAATYVGLIRLCIVEGEYERADSMIHVFENESGLFDENGNIERGREHYYCDKGFFYYKTGNIPLAKQYFRRGIESGNFLLAIRDMMDVYALERNPDSVIFYNEMYMCELEKQEAIRQTQTIQQMNSMYDYSRNQKLAAEKADEAKQNKTIAFCVAIFLLIVIFTIYIIYNRKRMQLTHELSQLNYKFLLAVSNYENVQNNLSSIGTEYSSYRQEMEEEVTSLRAEISEYKIQYAKLREPEREKAIMQSSVMETFKRKLPPVIEPKVIGDRTWQELSLIVEQCLPEFYDKITANNLLSQDELRLTILTRLKFSPGEISVIMDKTKNRVSGLRQRANSKLFSDGSAKTFGKNIMQL